MDVSRETLERLRQFEALLRKWNAKINLVAKSTLDEIWDRHIVNSHDAARHVIETPGTWLDIGSGGGLPGIVVAILREEVFGKNETVLVESDARKCSFLRAAARDLSLEINVQTSRVEDVPPMAASVISARAVAPLGKLFQMAKPHSTHETTFLFPKGISWKDEVEQARADFDFDLETQPSVTQEGAMNLIIRGLKSV